MDRREALKKLAIGSGAAVGTTAILTSRAFAGTAPSTPAPTVSIPNHADMNANPVITVSQGQPTCSRSATSFAITGTATATVPSGYTSNSPQSLTTSGSPRTATITVTPDMVQSGDMMTVQVSTTAVCNYPAAPTMLSSTCTTTFTATATVDMAAMVVSWAVATTTAQMCA